MANPSFTKADGSNPYIWAELCILPGDRPDLTTIANTDRAIVEYLSVGMIVGRKYLTTRGRLTLAFQRISAAMVQSLKNFAELAYFRLYPDADIVTYFEVYISNEFAPRWQPGGVYNLTLEIKQYSP